MFLQPTFNPQKHKFLISCGTSFSSPQHFIVSTEQDSTFNTENTVTSKRQVAEDGKNVLLLQNSEVFLIT